MTSAASDLVIAPAHEPPFLEDARLLIQEYAASLSFDLGFQNLDDEIATLPGPYAPPRGCLLVARSRDRSVGCVAVRALDRDTAELKRLWLRPDARGMGAGRKLVTRAVDDAHAMGYVRIRLDTTPEMGAAQALYRSLGFVDIDAYRPNPVPGTTYLELRLREGGAG